MIRRAYPNELYHHGIKGQKLGVRRYQNPDGSLTTAGKAHHASNKHADKLHTKAKSAEPRITADVRDAVKSTSAKMYGLKNRLKTKQSLARKIETDAYNDDISLEESASKVKDSVRYTALSPDKDFTKNYFAIKKSLEDKGYTETRCKNYFDLYNQGKVKHKSVQSVFKSPDGQVFELQFHTPSSQNAKNKKVPLYEEARKPGIDNARLSEIEVKMNDLAKTVFTPPNVYSIKSHG